MDELLKTGTTLRGAIGRSWFITTKLDSDRKCHQIFVRSLPWNRDRIRRNQFAREISIYKRAWIIVIDGPVLQWRKSHV